MLNRSVRPAAIIVALAGVAFAFSPALGQALQQASQPSAATPTGPQPRVEFEKLTHQFGVINDEREVSYEFKFRNTGDSNLEIFELKGSCGCTVPALDKKVYAPGESGQIKVIYNPNNRRGKQHTTVTVTTNDPVRAQLTLGLESEVKPTIMTEPQVASIGQVERGKEATTIITITSRRKDILPVQVTPGDAKVNATLKQYEEVEVDGEKLYRVPIEITLSPNAMVGPIQTQCVVRTTDPSRTLNFMVLGEGVGMRKAEPARGTLGGLAPALTSTPPFNSLPATTSPSRFSRSKRPRRRCPLPHAPRACRPQDVQHRLRAGPQPRRKRQPADLEHPPHRHLAQRLGHLPRRPGHQDRHARRRRDEGSVLRLHPSAGQAGTRAGPAGPAQHADPRMIHRFRRPAQRVPTAEDRRRRTRAGLTGPPFFLLDPRSPSKHSLHPSRKRPCPCSREPP